MTNYVVASSSSWFKEHKKSKDYQALNITEISSKEELSIEYLKKINPRYIFFPHWNWKVSAEIYEQFECVVFHTAPLPYGRGGSPIQNLILRGWTTSPVYALKMTDVLDGGPVYQSMDVSLDGSIADIFSRIAFIVESIIVSICKNTPNPINQTGDVVSFKRLSYKDNELHSEFSIKELYDRVRMVDGLNYPRAYICFGKYNIELSEAVLADDTLFAKIKIFPRI